MTAYSYLNNKGFYIKSMHNLFWGDMTLLQLGLHLPDYMGSGSFLRIILLSMGHKYDPKKAFQLLQKKKESFVAIIFD